MLVATVFAALVGVAAAQDLDYDLLDQLAPLSTASIPVVYLTNNTSAATAVTISYSQSAVIAAISSAISANPSDATPLLSNVDKRHLPTGMTKVVKRSSVQSGAPSLASSFCQVQPTGAGPVPSPDTASAFLQDDALASSASGAPTPSGYKNVFTNLQKSNSAYGYLGFSTLKSYDTQSCANKCNSVKGCQSFNIYFERDPQLNPNDVSCAQPNSTTQIKCVLWGSPVSSSNANNAGQYRNQFQVVVAGSNGYVSQTQLTPAGYTSGTFLDAVSINAPKDCNGNDTYLQMTMFTDGEPFDPNLCAAACSAQNKYAQKDGPNARLCKFFNTYILYKNGNPVGQNCAMYSQGWSTTSAQQNAGYWSKGDHYTIGSSWIYTNGTDSGTCSPSGSPIPPIVSSSTSFSSSSYSITSSSLSSSSSVLSSTTRSTSTPSASSRTSSTSSSASATSSRSSASSSASSSSTSSSSTSSSSISIGPSSTSYSSSSMSSISTTSSSVSYAPVPSISVATTNTTIGMTKSAYTVTPSLVIPTTTDINGIKPAQTHALDFEKENNDDTRFYMSCNITVNQNMVNIENFVPFIQKTDCSANSIRLAFTSSDALQMAKSSWPSSEFPLMTNDAYCGDGQGGRTFYNVTSVVFDTQSLSATLDVTEAHITEIANRVTTQWGTEAFDGSSSGQRKQKRTGQDGDTSFTIDSSTFLDGLEQFLNGYEEGSNFASPANFAQAICPVDSTLNYSPINIQRIEDAYGYTQTSDDNLVACPGCGLKATVSLYGGYDIELNPFSGNFGRFNYIHAGFRITDASLLIGFTLQGKDGFSNSFAKTLADVALPGIGVKDLLEVNPFVQLNTHIDFSISGGTASIFNVGVGWNEQRNIELDFDFLHGQVTQQGWFDTAPSLLQPVFQNMASDVSLTGSIGPAFGIEIDALLFSSKSAIGLETPRVSLDFTPRSLSSGITSCVDFSDLAASKSAFDLTLSVGVGVYVTEDLGNVLFGDLFSGETEIYSAEWPIASTCFVFDSQYVNSNVAPGGV